MTPPYTMVGSSDIAIDSGGTKVELMDGKLHFTARVRNNAHDDCSSCSTIIVGLPVEVKVQSFTAVGDRTGPLPWQECLKDTVGGMITVSVPDYVCSEEQADKTNDRYINIECIVEQSPNIHSQCRESFSIYVGSRVPDPDPTNNYWSWRRCTSEWKCPEMPCK